jgi:hypothetical protein
MALNPAGSLRRNRGLFIVVFLVCAAVFVGSLLMQRKALAKETAQAAAHARAIANEVDGLLGTKQLEGPIDAKTAAELDARLRHAIAGGGTVMAVRVWTPGGSLRYSSLPKDQSTAIQDTLSASTKGVGRIASVVDAEVMTTYVPLRTGPDGAPFGAVEVQASYTPVLQAAASPWEAVRRGSVIIGALMFVLIVIGSFAALPARRAAKTGAGFVGTRDPNAATSLSVEEFQRMQEELGEAEAARRAVEGELERVNARLAADNERATLRVTQLQGELGRVQTKLQEVQVAASARQAPTADDEELAGWKTRAEASEKKAVEAEHRAQMAEMRIGELTTQVRMLEEQLANAAQADAGADVAPGIDPEVVERLESEKTELASENDRLASEKTQLESERARIESEAGQLASENTRLSDELQFALERAREAEDLAASLNDQLLAAAESPAAPALPAAGPNDAGAHLDAVVASTQATTESDDDAGSLRSRLARAADRKRRPVKDESEWPD